MKSHCLALALVAAFAFGCGSSTEATSGPAVDGGTTPNADAGTTSAIDSGSTPAPTADAGAPPATDAGAPACTTKTYANFGQTFFAAKCNGCHSVQRPTLTSLSSIKTNIARCKSEISAGSMPVGSTLTPQEKTEVLEWLNCGAP